MVDFVPFLQPAQNGDRVLHGGSADDHRLETPFEGGVLLDMAAVLVESRRPYAVQLAAGEHRFQQVARVRRPLGAAGADDVVHLVDEQQDASLAPRYLPEDGLEPLLELTAVPGAGDKGPHVEGEDRAILHPLRDVAAQDALGQALDDRGLADSGLADQDGVVLGFSRQDPDDPADLAVAPDDGIQLPRARLRYQVDAVLLERLVGVLRVGAGHSLIAANRAQGPQQVVATDAMLPEDLRRFPVSGEDGKSEVLDGYELILEPVGFLFGFHQHLVEIPRHADAGYAPGQARSARKVRIQLPAHLGRGGASALEKAEHGPSLLVQQRQQQMFRIDLLVTAVESFALGLLQGLLRFLCQLVRVHPDNPLAMTVWSGQFDICLSSGSGQANPVPASNYFDLNYCFYLVNKN